MVLCSLFLINCTKAENSAKNIVSDSSSDTLLKVIVERKSIRDYTDYEVPDEKINEILTLAQRAPSAGNLQPYKIYVVKDKSIIKKLAIASHNQNAVSSAPQLLVFVALPEVSATRYGDRGKNLYSIQDTTIIAAYTQLVLECYDLKSVWIGAFNPKDVSEILKLNDSREKPLVILPFGQSERISQGYTLRKSLKDIVSYLKD